MKKILSWLWWLMVPLSCAAQNNKGTYEMDIFGRRFALKGDFPNVVFIETPLSLIYNSHCAGTLISLSKIISYASCFKKDLDDLSSFKVIGGTVEPTETSEGRQDRNIVKVTIDPRYNENSHSYNFAVAELDEPFEQSSTLSVMKMASEGEQKSKNAWLKLVGTGLTCLSLSWSDTNEPTETPNFLEDNRPHYSLKVVELRPWTDAQCSEARRDRRDGTYGEGAVCLEYLKSEEDICPSESGSIVTCADLVFGMGELKSRCEGFVYKNAFLFWPYVNLFKPPDAVKVNACATGTNEGMHFGGRLASNSEFPYTVHLEFLLQDNTTMICVGTLVSLRRIITCAHCFNKNYVGPLSSYKVFGGSVESKRPDEERQERTIVKVKVHEGYNENANLSPHDIAVAELNESFQKTSTLSAMKMASNDEGKNKKAWYHFMAKGKLCTAVSWGAEMSNCVDKRLYSDTLKVFELQPWTDDECNKAFHYGEGTIRKGDVCMTQVRAKEGICPSISGSTLMCDGYVFGIGRAVTACGTNQSYQSFLLFWPYLNYFGLSTSKCPPCSSAIRSGPVLLSFIATSALHILLRI